MERAHLAAILGGPPRNAEPGSGVWEGIELYRHLEVVTRHLVPDGLIERPGRRIEGREGQAPVACLPKDVAHECGGDAASPVERIGGDRGDAEIGHRTTMKPHAHGNPESGRGDLAVLDKDPPFVHASALDPAGRQAGFDGKREAQQVARAVDVVGAHHPDSPAHSRRSCMRRFGPASAWLVAGCTGGLLFTGCVAHYTDGLGYRARRAAQRQDVAAFERLMEEAADKVPSFPREKPKRTVLTHFLDLAAHPRFVSVIEHWQSKGWVSNAQTCAIQRARYRHVRSARPTAARQAAQMCIQRARAAAYAPDRAWEIEACLDEAPFLTETSTAALVPYLNLVVDGAEPRRFRRALLQGMTGFFVQDRFVRRLNAPHVPEAAHRALAEAQRHAVAARFTFIVETVRSGADLNLVGAGSAFGALELERAALTDNESFIAEYALESGEPGRLDLAWAWVKSAKAGGVIRRLESLGLWNRRVEPRGDAFWYACGRTSTAPIFGRADVEAHLRWVEQPRPATAVATDPACPGGAWTRGPFPLAATARGALARWIVHETGMARVFVREGARRPGGGP